MRNSKLRTYTLADTRANPAIGWQHGHHVGVLVGRSISAAHWVNALDLNCRADIAVDHVGQTIAYGYWYGRDETVQRHCASWARMARNAPRAPVSTQIRHLVTSVGADIDGQILMYFAHKYSLPGAKISGEYLDGDARTQAVANRYLATLNI